MNELPVGCERIGLASNVDHRGSLTELYRSEWDVCAHPIQWNLMKSAPDTLRGLHLHRYNWDYVVVVSGAMKLGLIDLRAKSPTCDQSVMLSLDGDKPEVVRIPPGVGHGFYFSQASTVVYGLSELWNSNNDIAFNWNDPKLGLGWPTAAPSTSMRDSEAPLLREIRHVIDQCDFELQTDAKTPGFD